ncbi:MAG: winged helix-turn-helix domain-containing protein [Candidatus Methanoperedens sp.]|nr:winged helix-turn-helix domain-containing protein [Candidatus Methanoperedens sp.]
MKKTKNPGSTAIKVANQKAILKALLHNDKSVQTIMNETEIGHQTISVHLAGLENEGMVMRMPGKDRREKIYSITPQGFLKLNILDDRLKTEYFSLMFSCSLMWRTWIAEAEDQRLPEGELNKIRDARDKLPPLTSNDRKSWLEYYDLIREIHRKNNISNPIQPHESILNELRSFAGELVLYIAAKAVKENNLEYLNLLEDLPTWYYSFMKSKSLDVDYILSKINRKEEFDYSFSTVQTLTLEDYKEYYKYCERFFKKHPQYLNK